MIQKFMSFLRNEEGATAIEYGLIVGLIAVVLVAVLLVLGGDEGLNGLFKHVAACVSSAGCPGG
jgi:pilus assembly protein Flp/PilA